MLVDHVLGVLLGNVVLRKMNANNATYQHTSQQQHKTQITSHTTTGSTTNTQPPQNTTKSHQIHNQTQANLVADLLPLAAVRGLLGDHMCGRGLALVRVVAGGLGHVQAGGQVAAALSALRLERAVLCGGGVEEGGGEKK